MFIKSKAFVMISIALFIFFGITISERCTPQDKKKALLQTGNNEFTGDKTCKSCHADQDHEWKQSHHFMAMQPANDSTVPMAATRSRRRLKK